MSSEIRTNLIKSRAGLSTVTLSDTGPVVTGIATFGVTTKIDGGNNVINVGTALTIGHTQGVQFHTQNLHSTGFEVNQVNASGIITASSYRGDGSQLTGISAGFSPDAQGNLVAGTNAGDSFSGTDANHNVLLGLDAGTAITTADGCIFIGQNAGEVNTTRGSLVAIGNNSGTKVNNAYGFTALGGQAGQNHQTGQYCVYIGYSAGRQLTGSATDNTIIGGEAHYNATSGSYNVSVGKQAMSLAADANNCTAVGTNALQKSSQGGSGGDNNTALGYEAGDELVTGSNCTILGFNAQASSTSVSNEITLGNANVTKFRIPGLNYVNDAGNVGLGISNPSGQLHISSGTSGDCRVYIEADTDNNNEGDNPFIIFKNDGGYENAAVWAGNADGANDNSLNLSAGTDAGGGIRFFTSAINNGWETAPERLRITSGGEVQIGKNEGSYRLNVTRESSDTTTAETQLLLYAKHDGSGNTGVGFGGGIRFWGDRNSDNVEQNMGRIMCIADVNSGTNISGALVFETGQAGVLGEKLRITSDGVLQLASQGSTFRGRAYGSNNFEIRGTGTNNNLEIVANANQENVSDGDIVFKSSMTGGGLVEKMRIKASGNVCINTTSNLINESSLSADSSGNTVVFRAKGNSQHNPLICWNNHTSGNRQQIQFGDGSSFGSRGSIKTNGANVIYGGTSDYRKKQDDVLITDGIEKIKLLKPKRFKWKDAPDLGICDGFFAHEVQEVIPTSQAVTGTKDEVDSDGNPVYQEIDQSKLVPLLTAGLQELITKVEKLEQENISLRIRVTNLEDK